MSCVWGGGVGSGECYADLVEGSISVRDGKGEGKKKETNQKYFIVERVPDRLCPPIEACGCSSDSLGFGSPVSRDEWLGRWQCSFEH